MNAWQEYLGRLNANHVCGKPPGTIGFVYGERSIVGAFRPRGWNSFWNPRVGNWMPIEPPPYELVHVPDSLDVMIRIAAEPKIDADIPGRIDYRNGRVPLHLARGNANAFDVATGEKVERVFFYDEQTAVLGRYVLTPSNPAGSQLSTVWEIRAVRFEVVKS